MYVIQEIWTRVTLDITNKSGIEELHHAFNLNNQEMSQMKKRNL
jgi:hypothetical protein